MAIYRLFQSHAFDPDAITAMATAYEKTLLALGLTDRSDPLTNIVAEKIIETFRRGESDPDRLREIMLEYLARRG